MSTSTAIEQLLSVLPDDSTITPDTTLAISVSQLGSPRQTILSGTLSDLARTDPSKFGGPLHSFVIVGKRLHPIERDFAARFAADKSAAWFEVANVNYACLG